MSAAVKQPTGSSGDWDVGVHQILVSASAGDAITNNALGIRSMLRKVGPSEIFARHVAPGLWLQRITTQPPSDDQAICAITALDQAMALEKERGGELVIA